MPTRPPVGMRSVGLLATLAAIARASSSSSGGEGAGVVSLTLTVVDGETGRPVPCRLLVQTIGGDGGAPVSLLPAAVRSRYDPAGKVLHEVKPQAFNGTELWFATSGVADDISVPVPATGLAPAVTVRAERGHEYTRVKTKIELGGVRGSGPVARTLTLRRWVDTRSEGWVTVDNHVHTDAVRESLGAWLAAEDVSLGTMLYWHNGVDSAYMPLPPPTPGLPPWMRALPAAPVADGQPAQTNATVLDAEKEDAFGAVYMLHNAARQAFAWNGSTPNFVFTRAARAAGGFVTAQAGWSREAALDALLGTVDAVNVCNNVYEFHAFQTRSEYSNLLNVPGLPTYPDTFEGMFGMNTQTLYRLWNAGARLAVGGGSASGLEFKRTTVGYSRTHVRARAVVASGGIGPSGVDAVYASWAAGASFCTTGGVVVDVLEETTRSEVGAVVALPGASDERDAAERTLRFRVTARSEAHTPLTAVHLVVNGEVVDVPLDPGATPTAATGVVNVSVGPTSGLWACGVAHANDTLLTDDELGRYTDPVSMRVQASRRRFAHTSPVYVTVGGEGASVAASVRETGAILEYYLKFARGAADPRFASAVAGAVAEANTTLHRRTG